MERQRRRRRENLSSPFVILLLAQLYQQVERLPVRPPVTLGLIAFMVILHLHPPAFPALDIPVSSACLSPAAALAAFASSDLTALATRLLGSAFLHGSDTHLYYNMASFLYKGAKIETDVGPLAFAVLLFAILTISHSLFIFLSLFLADLHLPFASPNACAVGFSAVIFGLKYFLNASETGLRSIHGILVSAPKATWVELVLVSLLHPEASLLGHLCGILAGMVLFHTELIPYRKLGDALGKLLGLNLMAGGPTSSTSSFHPSPSSSSSSSSSRPRYTYASGFAAGHRTKVNRAFAAKLSLICAACSWKLLGLFNVSVIEIFGVLFVSRLFSCRRQAPGDISRGRLGPSKTSSTETNHPTEHYLKCRLQ